MDISKIEKVKITTEVDTDDTSVEASIVTALNVHTNFVRTEVPFPIRIYLYGILNTGYVDAEIDPRVDFLPDGVLFVRKRILSYLDKGQRIDRAHLSAMAHTIADIIGRAFSKGFARAFQPEIETKPLWEHDCDGCFFLGSFGGVDHYYCSQGYNPTLIARYGHDSRYISGAAFANADKRIWKSAVLAEHRDFGKFLEGTHSIWMGTAHLEGVTSSG